MFFAALVAATALLGDCKDRFILDAKPVQSWTRGEDRLVLCSYGAKPEQQADGSWQASELFVTLVTDGQRQQFLHAGALETVRYTVDAPRFTFEKLTLAAEDRQWIDRVPLLRYDGTIGDAAVRRRFVLPAETFDEAKLNALIEQFLDADLEDTERERLLYRMRDIAASRPLAGLRLLERLTDSRWNDGAMGDAILEVIAEVELARDCGPVQMQIATDDRTLRIIVRNESDEPFAVPAKARLTIAGDPLSSLIRVAAVRITPAIVAPGETKTFIDANVLKDLSPGRYDLLAMLEDDAGRVILRGYGIDYTSTN